MLVTPGQSQKTMQTGWSASLPSRERELLKESQKALKIEKKKKKIRPEFNLVLIS